MNLLSHALLSQSEDDHVLTVNVLWDFIGKDLRQDRRDFVSRRSEIHRAIDRETDCSEEFKQALLLVSDCRESVSGVVVDIALDYALSHDWNHYSPDNRLELFERFYDRMEKVALSIGERAVSLIASMREGNWFKSYGELAGIERVFRRLASRYGNLNSIIGAEIEINRNVDKYLRLMRSFYTKVEAAVKRL